jgi:hypothetical protein
VEFRRFLSHVDAHVPADLDVHLILDNSSTHKTPMIHRWLLRHPRFHLHFTPTGATWLNLVERFFAAITEKQIRRGTTAAPANWSRPSTGTSTIATATPSPSSGPRAPTRSWRAWPDSLIGISTQDTSGRLAGC